MERDELIALVERILGTEPKSEEETRLLRLFQANVSHPSAANLIFVEEEFTLVGLEREPTGLTPEQIVDTALAYEPIPLGPASDIAKPS
jgi:alkylhydroperoxidase family enzyme